MHRFDLDVDVDTRELMPKVSEKKAKKAKRTKKAKKAKQAKKKAKAKGKDIAVRKKAKKREAPGGRGAQKKAKEVAAGKNAGKVAAGKQAKELKEMTLQLADVSVAFSPTRGERSFRPERAMQLGFVELGEDHPRPRAGKAYPVVSASSEKVGRVDYPGSHFRRMHLDLYEFFFSGRPDFLSSKNEGMLKIQVATKNPQDLRGGMTDAAFVTGIRAKNGSYAPGSLDRGVFRNVLLQDWATLGVELHELDSDASKLYAKFGGVLSGVSELKSLDVLKGLPYLNLATQLFDGLITSFGRDAEDHFWGELPVLEVNPTPGGAFLRTGIYLLGEKLNRKKRLVELDRLEYQDGRVSHKKGKGLPTHLLFGVSLVEHEEG